MKSLLAVTSLAVVVSLNVRAEDVYKIDPAHTTVGFSVEHMVINEVKGRFKDLEGTITVDSKKAIKLTNITGSKKVMVVQIALMTHYDNRVFDNVKKHEFALRSAMLDVMRQSTEADIAKPEFRKDLAAKLKDTMNELLENYEDFGGIEDVFFTSFVMQ